MDISAIKTPVDVSNTINVVQTISVIQPVTGAPSVNTGNDAVKTGVSSDDKVQKKPAGLQDVKKMTDAMNEFVEAMDANIRFTVHQKTKELMVQVVDQANNKVIKEFPSHEFLDTVAAIRSYVGILLDKKI